uniref:Cytochrome P450 CYP72A219-like n=1 Tax=Nelumbo nucifera TaxID=4432 RepID=A0A822YI14_NELNU|nr:TPA_asm: hypothetical protein HUJ06_012685 [Nelumbo nucifera]
MNVQISDNLVLFCYLTNLQLISFFWVGTSPRVTIVEPNLIRDILSNKLGHFEKPKLNPLVKLFTTGLANYEGEQWAKHRRIINPAFHQGKLKRMLPAFHTSCHELVSRWEELATPEGSCELDVWPEFQNLTGDAISRTAFGSNYEEGKRIFQLQNEQAKLILQHLQSIYIPGVRFLPTTRNNRIKEIERELQTLLRYIINKREEALKLGEASKDDLLSLLIESNQSEIQEHGNISNAGMSIEEVIEECKLFYFAEQETTSNLLVWTMIVLSKHVDWQMRAREEVLQVFDNNKPNHDGLNHLKIVTMIFYEVLRLYPPAFLLLRSIYKKVKLGHFTLPPGVQLALPTILIHHDRGLWGEDAEEFRPERFSEGISNATKNQVSFFPFGWVPGYALGRTLP